MRYLMIHHPGAVSGPPSPEFMAEMGKFVEAEMKAGRLIATGGLLPVAQGGARVKSEKGKFTVLDGPFAESKEVIAGFALMELKSRDEALDASRRFYAIAGDGTGEIFQVI
jgi:hypothetical protein